MDLIFEKSQIIDILNEVAVLLELKGENPFKSRAYSNAARILETEAESLEELITSGHLGEIKGIGKALEEKIRTLATTGELDYLTELRAQFPPSLFDLLKVPNLGPKKVKVLYQELHIKNLDELENACRQEKVRGLSGFGSKTEMKILEGIEQVRHYQARVLLPLAECAADELFQWITAQPETIRASICGSLRRRCETIKDIDLLASSDVPERLIEGFTALPAVHSITGKGSTKASVVLSNGMNADLRVVSEEDYPFALHYFTGNKVHNTAMRSRAKSFGLKMNEYGFYHEDGTRISCRDESEIYSILNLAYIPPELREGTDEIVWAESKAIPELVGYHCLKGTLHCHTTASDGTSTLEEMAEAAVRMGYQYLGIADHSKSASYANGLDEKRLALQWKEIDQFNQQQHRIRILKGTEVDILRDGSLDFAEEVLRDCDYAVASVHSQLTLDEETMTNRLIRAIESPGITFIGHLTGRLLLKREPSHINLGKVLDAIAGNRKWIEVNANPWRLDIDWRICREAKKRNILVCINPDAHSDAGLQDNRYGIDVVRKAGLSSPDIANTRPLQKFIDLLQGTRI